MRYQILLLLACWLWIVTTSEADECVRIFWCNSYNDMIMEGYNFTCEDENNGYINIKCEDFNSGMPNCNVLYITDDISSLGQNHPTSSSSPVTGKPTSCTPQDCESIDKPTLCIPAECECTPTSDNINTASEVTSAAVNDKRSTSNFLNSTIVATLGALVGVLLVSLATVSAILAWTCWLLKKQNGTKFNTEYQLRGNTDHGQLVNPTYEGDDLLHLQPEQPIPAYETIPPHPRDGARLEFMEQGENGYHVLSREQRPNPETASTTQRMETILEDSREESYSKLESREGSGSSKKENEEGMGEYSKLEIVNIGSIAPMDSTCKVSDATVESSDDSSEQTEGKVLSIMDNEAFNDNGDDLQLENSDAEKGQEEAKWEGLPEITVTLDEHNERKDSTDPETSTTEDGACA